MKRGMCYFLLLLVGNTTLWKFAATAHDQKPGLVRAHKTTTHQDTLSGKRLYWGQQVDGYVVYNKDTMHGLIMLYRKELVMEQPIDADYSYFYKFKMKDTALKTVVMYNEDKKPVCLTRAHDKSNRLLRLVHEGKLNIYDGRIGFVYRPKDIDKYLLVVSYDGITDDLSSFLTETTKSDLIMYINDIYGTHFVPKQISWRQLLLEIDRLD